MTTDNRPRVAVTYRSEEKVIPYEEALRAVGVEPVRVHVNDMQWTNGRFDGVLLTGGPDVNPIHYGEEPSSGLGDVDADRDVHEIEFAKAALEAQVPLFAICRGMQLLNVIRGGTLIQDLGSAHLVRTGDVDPPGAHRAIHPVDIRSGTRLAGILQSSTVHVNSRHHQAIRRLGSGLTVSAVAPDGTIEGVEEAGERFLLGVQWHPEDRILASQEDRALFDAFRTALDQARAS